MLCEQFARLYARIDAVTSPANNGCLAPGFLDAYLKMDARIMVRPWRRASAGGGAAVLTMPVGARAVPLAAGGRRSWWTP